MPTLPARLVAVLAAAAFLAAPAASERPRKARRQQSPVEQHARDTQRVEGLLPIRIDARAGRVWLEVPPPAEASEVVLRLLWVESLVTGLGSNPVGLDRGQLGATRLVALRRLGGKVLLEEENLRFRALSPDEAERRATREAFATSVVWAGPIAAEDPDGRLLVDFTPFLLRDAHRIASTLESTGQGEYSLDVQRSSVDPAACLAFPENLVFESLLTFSGSKPGDHVRSVAPEPHALTFRVRHQLVRLPEPGYEPRRWHPSGGAFAITFADHAAPLDEPVERHHVVRHRLEPLDEEARRTRVRKPIVYHVDPGIPEPVRSAVVEGASWWAAAFEAAGYDDAFRVELLPRDAHPLDLRYNVIEWVHRSTRGWSYGTGVVDPRTGERLKGQVNLGSLRVRQDRLLIEGLAGTRETGKGGPDDPVQVALARIRQLAAHEVGHALGMAHNFAASTYAGRASVMDYPAPLVRVTPGGSFDFSDAYGRGVGAWDRHAILLAYGRLGFAGDLQEQLVGDLVREARARGLIFLSDSDARPAGAAHPLANLWDNGPDPVGELHHVLRVRRLALARFGEEAVRPATPLSLLQERLAPVYLLHRYQVPATAKSLGGFAYHHLLRGDLADPTTPVPPDQQRRALAALLSTLDPAELDLPDSALTLLLPRPPGLGRNRELFQGRTAPAFDALGAAATAADLTLAALLQPERCARLVDQHRREASLPGLEEVLATVEEAVFAHREGEPERLREIRRVVQAGYVRALGGLTIDPRAASSVLSRARWRLRRLDERLASRPAADEAEAAHVAELRAAIEAGFERRRNAADGLATPLPPPPGSPIGLELTGGCSLDG